jgi:hypothetical protein
MWINHKYKFIFIAVPKCASTSIINTLGFELKSKEPREYHSSIEMVQASYGDYDKYQSFAFIRNPWDRLVSTFLDGVQSTGHQNAWSKDLLVFKDFNDFVTSFQQTRWVNWVHFLPCSSFVKTHNQISVDYIGRYENLQNDFGAITTKLLGKPTPLCFHENRTKRDKDYRKYFTRDTIKIVSEVYREDIKRFNYEF